MLNTTAECLREMADKLDEIGADPYDTPVIVGMVDKDLYDLSQMQLDDILGLPMRVIPIAGTMIRGDDSKTYVQIIIGNDDIGMRSNV